MPRARVIVVGETPSLGGSVAELLMADGIETLLVPTLGDGEARASESEPGTPFVVVAAANGPRCETLRHWPQSPLSRCDLVVVGDRDTGGSPRPRVHIVALPMRPLELLLLVRDLTALAAVGPSPPHDPRLSESRRALVAVPRATSAP